MDTNRLRELLDQRDKLDDDIRELVNGERRERKAQSCSVCSQIGHSKATCPNKPKDTTLHLPKGDNTKKGEAGKVT